MSKANNLLKQINSDIENGQSGIYNLDKMRKLEIEEIQREAGILDDVKSARRFKIFTRIWAVIILLIIGVILAYNFIFI